MMLAMLAAEYALPISVRAIAIGASIGVMLVLGVALFVLKSWKRRY